MYKCKYCDFENDNRSKLAGHTLWCKNGPNRGRNLNQLAKARTNSNNKTINLHSLCSFTCCKCGISFKDIKYSDKLNHIGWCMNEPRKEKLIKRLRHTSTDPSVREKISKGVSEAHRRGAYLEAYAKMRETRLSNKYEVSQETREKIRVAALNSSHRRLVRSVRDYVRKDGSIVKLDSSWEEALAKRLDFLNIEWVRPETPIKYTGSDSREHNYYPDFYLTCYDLYIDPKNPAAYKSQIDKINILITLLPNLIILTSLYDCENFTL